MSESPIIGWLMPQRLGGRFLPVKEHCNLQTINYHLKLSEIEYDEMKSRGEKMIGLHLPHYIRKWKDTPESKRMYITEHDILAYKAFCEKNPKFGNDEFADWAIDFLGCTKVGTKIKEDTYALVTSDLTPHITYGRLIKQHGLEVVNTEHKLGFDEKTKKFSRIDPTLFHRAADRTRKEEILGE